MIHVIATIRAASGRRDALLEQFAQLVPKVHAEAGCVQYQLTRDIETGIDVQAPIDGDVLTLVEQWQSLEHLQAHLAADHMQAFFAEADTLIASLSIRVTEPV